jgi:hypothetical protein
MANPRSQSLVIDASVARAAGPEDAVHPTAKRCRDFLLAVLSICHRAVFTQAIADEWKKHQSGFAKQWRLSMFARKKIDRLDVPEDVAFRDQLTQATTKDKDRNAMLKDSHLIEAALLSEMRIVALDEIVRGHFRAAAASIGRLKEVCWVNPDKPDETPVDWLQAGAPADNFRKLGHGSTEE